ncbi:MAG TPA: ATP-binding cassette domain-containing protein [Chloroflexi bacterium]|nr:ATP-binding cassette domain-containing protein [Chloroflexota bacterium]
MAPKICIHDLEYAYPPLTPGGPPIPALRGVNLHVEQGEFLSIMGPTGAGKTTLCLALNGIIPHSLGGTFRGDVIVGGLDTKVQTVPTLAARVGVVFQDPDSQFFTMTVEDEVAFGPETLGLPPAEIRERVDWALGVVGMSDCRARSPLRLSGGQKQRVAIAAILAMKPDVLVLDEPTSGLDQRGKVEVFRAIEELRRREGLTILMVEQDAEQIAAFSDRVAILQAGQVVLVDTPSAVFTQVEVMREVGLAVPQVSDLAVRLNERCGSTYTFTLFEQAYEALKGKRMGGAMAGRRDDSADERVDHCSPILQVQDLWYRYSDEIVALRGITLDIEAGDFVAVIGQNGSGKTTLVKHFNGLYRPTQGQVLLDGQDTRVLAVSDLARVVGYVFQNPDHQIFGATTREEIGFGPRNLGLVGSELEERVAETLTYFGLTEYADAPPAVLGFGIRRKIGVAAVYAMRPRVFVLDEPMAGLDEKGRLELMRALQAMREGGSTIIWVTHDVKAVCQFARRVLVLHDGRVAAYGDTRAVFGAPDIVEGAGLELLQITRLAQALASCGMRRDVLTVDEFCAAYLDGGRERP